MKKFQKINDELFQAIPENKLNTLTGGRNGTSISDISSTGSCECVDAGDVDANKR